LHLFSINSSRRRWKKLEGGLIAYGNYTNHFTILDELRQPNSTLTRAVIAMAEYQTA